MSRTVIDNRTGEIISSGTDLILPSPQDIPMDGMPAIFDHSRRIRAVIRRTGDIAAGVEHTRRLAAFRRYVQDRQAKDGLAAEQRRTEVVIGHLLGPAVDGKPDVDVHREVYINVGREDRRRFRLLAAHEAFVEQLLASGKVSRPVILEKIERALEAERWAERERQRVTEHVTSVVEVNDEWPDDLGEVDDGDDLEDLEDEQDNESGLIRPPIIMGDFRDDFDRNIETGSATLVLTDPPYETGALHLYSDLAERANRWLRPGGSLICYTGQATMPEALARLSEHLRYWWTLALTHSHGGQQLPGKWVLVEWKPVLWFVKDYRLGREYVADRLRGSSTEKSHHEWAQGIEEVKYLVERLTEPNELVLDPFAGSGSFGRAALALGRRFLGADVPGGDTFVTPADVA